MIDEAGVSSAHPNLFSLVHAPFYMQVSMRMKMGRSTCGVVKLLKRKGQLFGIVSCGRIDVLVETLGYSEQCTFHGYRSRTNEVCPAAGALRRAQWMSPGVNPSMQDDGCVPAQLLYTLHGYTSRLPKLGTKNSVINCHSAQTTSNFRWLKKIQNQQKLPNLPHNEVQNREIPDTIVRINFLTHIPDFLPEFPPKKLSVGLTHFSRAEITLFSGCVPAPTESPVTMTSKASGGSNPTACRSPI